MQNMDAVGGAWMQANAFPISSIKGKGGQKCPFNRSDPVTASNSAHRTGWQASLKVFCTCEPRSETNVSAGKMECKR